MNIFPINKYFMQTFDRLYFRLHAEKIEPHQEFDISRFSSLIKQEYLENPELFYRKPDRVPSFSISRLAKVDNIEIFDIRFPSPIKTDYEQNNTACGYYFKAIGKRGSMAVILLHGWGRKSLQAEKRFALRLAREGIHCLILKLPFHFERAPKGMWSGEYILTGDVLKIIEATHQYVIEARVVSSWLRGQAEKICIVGMSLGGMMAHLTMAVESFHAGVTILSGGNNAGIIWDGISTRLVKKGLIKAGITRELASYIFQIVNPTVIAKFNKTKNLFMINGLYDEVVPKKCTVELWDALGRPKIKWYPFAHVSIVFFMKSVVSDAIQFLHERNNSL